MTAISAMTTTVRAHSSAVKMAVTFGIGKQDRIDDSVGALCRFDGFPERLLAAVIDAIAENHESLPALLLAHQFVRPQIYGVIKMGTASARATAMAATS